MAQYTPWLPTSRDNQLHMAKTWCDVLARYAAEWHIPEGEATDLEYLAVAATEILQMAKSSDRTTAITVRCRSAFDTLIARMRSTKERYFLSPPLVDADYPLLLLRARDGTITLIPPPTAQVSAQISFPGVHLVELSHIMPINGPSDDPRSDWGVRIFFGFAGAPNSRYSFRLQEPPVMGSHLPYSEFTRRQKHRFDWEGESGNTVYICLRYENEKGEPGPFGPLIHAVIP